MSAHEQRTAIAGLLLFFVCGNLVGPSLFWNAGDWGFWTYCALVATGGLVAEGCLLGIWAALGPQALIFRLPLTSALLLVLICAYMIGLQLPEDWMPLEAATAVILAATLTFVGVQLPLWLMGAIAGQRIDVPGRTDGARSKSGSSQFGLRHLLIATTAVALLLVLVQHAFPDALSAGPTDWMVLVLPMFLFLGFTVALCAPCVWLALRDNPGGGWGPALAIAVVCGPVAVGAAMSALPGVGPVEKEAYLGVFFFGAGIVATVLSVLRIMRGVGYRLVSAADGEPVKSVAEAGESNGEEDGR